MVPPLSVRRSSRDDWPQVHIRRRQNESAGIQEEGAVAGEIERGSEPMPLGHVNHPVSCLTHRNHRSLGPTNITPVIFYCDTSLVYVDAEDA
eukprot:3530921-Pyramimonas_sp.AAC.1